MTESPLYGGTSTARVRVHHLQQAKERGEKWAMLTAYDMYAAEIFDEAGIPCLLVGDSAGNNVLAYETTVPVTVGELLPLVRAVAGSATRALVVADLPFGSYGGSPEQGLAFERRSQPRVLLARRCRGPAARRRRGPGWPARGSARAPARGPGAGGAPRR